MMTVLAEAYRSGKYGLAVDLKKADEWDAKAKETIGAPEVKEEKKQATKKKRI